MTILSRLRSNASQPGTVTLPLAEYHATQIALEGAVARIDELERADADRATILCRQVEVIAERTDERDRARRWAVHLEQETADLEGVNQTLRTRITTLEQQIAEAGLERPLLPPIGGEIEGVPA